MILGGSSATSFAKASTVNVLPEVEHMVYLVAIVPEVGPGYRWNQPQGGRELT
jgi:hypothetical protein